MNRRHFMKAVAALPCAALAAGAAPLPPALPMIGPAQPMLPMGLPPTARVMGWVTDAVFAACDEGYVMLEAKSALLGETASGHVLAEREGVFMEGGVLRDGEEVALWACMVLESGPVAIRPLPDGDDPEAEDRWHEERIITGLTIPPDLSQLPGELGAGVDRSRIGVHLCCADDPDEMAVSLDDLTSEWEPGETHVVEVVAWVPVRHRYEGATGTLEPMQWGPA